MNYVLPAALVIGPWTFGLEITSAVPRRRWWIGFAIGLGIAFAPVVAKRILGYHPGSAAFMAVLAFSIVYRQMRRTQGASRSDAMMIALVLATVAAAWFYVIGI